MIVEKVSDNTQAVLDDGAKPALSGDAFLLRHGGNGYLFAPHTRTYARTNDDLRLLLRECDGNRTIGDLRRSHDLGEESRLLFAELHSHGVLVCGENGPAAAPACGPTPSSCVETGFAGITLFPTYACNLACTYCYARGGERPLTMDPGLATSFLDWFFAQVPESEERLSLSFHGGGEPTLHFSLLRAACEDFAKRCKAMERPYRIGIVSNGTYSEEIAQWFIQEKISVNLSIDGPPDIQNAQRPFCSGRPSHPVVTENLRRLVDAGCEPAVRVTVTDKSLDAMPAILDHFIELGAAGVQLEPCFNVGRCEETGIAEPDPDVFAGRFLECFKKGLEHDVEVTYSGLRCTESAHERFCGACGGSIALTPDGNITTCFEVVAGDDPAAERFFVGRFDAETGEAEFDQERLAYLASRVTRNLTECSACFLKHNCAGDCLVKAFRSAGSMFSTVALRCKMAQKINSAVVAWIADEVIVPRNEGPHRVFKHGDCPL